MTDDAPRRSWWRAVLWSTRVVAVVLAAIILWRLFAQDPALPRLPSPNGYDDLARAAALVVGDEARPREAPVDELRGFVEQNGRALALLRAGLAKQCGVPLAGTLQEQVEAGVKAVGPIRTLGRLVESEGWLARQDGRKDDAIRAGLDLVRLGSESGRGGLLIQYQTGCALVTLGVNFLARLRGDLDADDCRKLVRALEAIDAAREPADAVVARERAFVRRNSAWQIRIQMALPRSPIHTVLRASENSTALSSGRTEAYLRLLVADLALQAYRLDHDGANPRDLVALVPSYLAAVPVDPFNGQPLRYRNEQGAMRLYSVGPDLQDDGGAPVPRSAPNSKGDVQLEPR